MNFRHVLCRHCPDYDPDRMYDGRALSLPSAEGGTLGVGQQRPSGSAAAGISSETRGHRAATTGTSASGTSTGSSMG